MPKAGRRALRVARRPFPGLPFPGGDPLAGRRLPWGLTRRHLRLIAAAIVAVLAAIGLLPGGEIHGPAEAIDGDTLTVGAATVRLYGIDAPELDQPCRDGQGACGLRARQHLNNFVAFRTLVCTRRDTDRYGREVAICRVLRDGDTETAHGIETSGIDVGREMVRTGQAMAYREITSLYVPEEPAQFDFDPPWDWRAEHAPQ